MKVSVPSLRDMSAVDTAARPVWSSQRAYILASVAGIVGLGNLWRFPYMAGENGGGTFVLAYAICVIALGVPLSLLEASAGRLVRRGPVGLFRHVNPVWGPWMGWFLVAMTLVIMSYYFVISGWTLGYAIDALRGDLRGFDDFTAGGASVWYFLMIAAIVMAVLMRGIGGLEQSSRLLVPLLVMIVGGLAIYSQTLSGASDGRDFYLSFDLESFGKPQTWQMAAGQAFYSLSIGLGFLITYGSYTPPRVNVVRSSLAVAATNTAVSLTAGLLVFPIVFTFGIAPDTGSELSFTAFPKVFGELPAGHLVGVGFFLLLFLAAITSCYGGMMIALAAVRDELRISRTKAAVIVTGVAVALGLPSALSFTPVGLAPGGKPFLEYVDQIVGSGVVVAAGILGAALIAWRIPRDQLVQAMNSRGARLTGTAITVGRYLPVAAVIVLVVTYTV